MAAISPRMLVDLIIPYDDEITYLYLISLVFATGEMVAAWAIWQYTIYVAFSRQQLTKLTASPYKVAGLALASMLFECVLLGSNFMFIYDEFQAAESNTAGDRKFFQCQVSRFH